MGVNLNCPTDFGALQKWAQLRLNLQVQQHEAIWIMTSYHQLSPEERAIILPERVRGKANCVSCEHTFLAIVRRECLGPPSIEYCDLTSQYHCGRYHR